MSIMNITQANYDELVRSSSQRVLLDFWAPWCGPCRMVAPIVEEIAAQRPEILVGKINVDEEMALASQFGIVSIPTLVAITNGEITGKIIGYRPKEEIEELLAE